MTHRAPLLQSILVGFFLFFVFLYYGWQVKVFLGVMLQKKKTHKATL